jgi:hypothetical protein
MDTYKHVKSETEALNRECLAILSEEEGDRDLA